MKRLLFCLVAVVMVMAFVVPCYSAEMKINGINRLKFISHDNFDGNKKTNDSNNFVKQRMRMYFTSIASENLKVVYKNEIDFEWGDNSFANARGEGGRLGGDTVNLETKNVYMEMMIPNTPLKATLGLQGVTLHKGWFMSDDVAAARFDVNLDPFSVLAYWAHANDQDFTSSSDDDWHLVASGAYKAENMDARLSFGYERGVNDPNNLVPGVITKDDNFYLLMGEFGMSFDMVSFYAILGLNAGKRKNSNAKDNKYKGTMAEVQVDFALDIATLYVNFRYASGEKEKASGQDFGFRGMSGQTYSWSEILSDGYFWEANANLSQIDSIGDNGYAVPGHSPSNHPSNMWAIAGGADIKPTDTTSIGLDLYYVKMIKKRPSIVGNNEKDIGFEVDLDVTQKIYDNLDMKIVGAYMFAGDAFGNVSQTSKSRDNAYVLGLGFNYKF